MSMPSGGGSGTVTVTPNVRLRTWTFIAIVQTNTSTTSVNQYSESVASAPNNVTGVNNSNGTVTLTYTGQTG